MLKTPWASSTRVYSSVEVIKSSSFRKTSLGAAGLAVPVIIFFFSILSCWNLPAATTKSALIGCGSVWWEGLCWSFLRWMYKSRLSGIPANKSSRNLARCFDWWCCFFLLLQTSFCQYFRPRSWCRVEASNHVMFHVHFIASFTSGPLLLSIHPSSPDLQYVSPTAAQACMAGDEHHLSHSV